MQSNRAKGIVLPSTASEAFKPVTYQRPVGLLPVVNKPIIEHQIEWFVRHDVKNIRISSNHLSNHIEEYFDTGSRWGASLSYNYERPPFGYVAALQQMRPYFEDDSLVIISSDIVTDVDLFAVLDFHWDHGADATFVCVPRGNSGNGLALSLDDQHRVHAVGMHLPPQATQLVSESGICVLEPGIVEILPEIMGHNLLQACWLAAQHVRLRLLGYVVSAPVRRIANWQNYHDVQREILAGEFPGVLVPGIQLESGVWVGKNLSVSSHVSFQAPLVVGDNCRIGRGVRLGKNTIIGHDVMVDVGAVLDNVVVFPKTFIGPQVRIQNAVVQGNMVIDVSKNAFDIIDDHLAATALEGASIGYSFYRFLNRVLAATALVVFSPLLLVLLVFMTMSLKFPLISRVKRIVPDLKELSAGKLRLRVIDLLFLGPVDTTKRLVSYNPNPLTRLPAALARIGNLVNVVRGDVMIVGNRPMDPEIAFAITEEYRRTRFKCQAGIVSVLDTGEVEDASEEEQVIAEGYYAINRTVWMDLGILLRSLGRFLVRLLSFKRVERAYTEVPPEEHATYG